MSTQVDKRRIERRLDRIGHLTERTAGLGDLSQTETFTCDCNEQLIQVVNSASQLQWYFD
ncbi:hypothetical protein N5F23_19355 [Pseudomonas sichuanensis]|uniref:hypothetical protein n=1 Tax=Pseudomonas sichuanensis TaxID=2213015 RepID=UPI002447954B|nr:hypothetical protein [Pseudomonas sichuanensis]MDH0729907.1 hypothetical protein [Pseudomonas sichuanensis]MDH1584740.1 hypothetical protein [Pseudomonas sichuanensis]MDH1594005.1 hypothetical protein [Pseudomonas sichuanensis]MDH1600517.1 hypothetical protein [Pseudomonas sichuanensis]